MEKFKHEEFNAITLRQRQTDSNNQSIITSKCAVWYNRYERVIWDLSIWINLITLNTG